MVRMSMTVIPLHPLLRRTTGPERRNQPSEVTKLAVAFERSSIERLSSKTVAIQAWLELLFGPLSIDMYLPGLPALPR